MINSDMADQLDAAISNAPAFAVVEDVDPLDALVLMDTVEQDTREQSSTPSNQVIHVDPRFGQVVFNMVRPWYLQMFAGI